MGNKTPVCLPRPTERVGYNSCSYTTKKIVYLQKSCLGGDNLVLEAVDPGSSGIKNSLQQYPVPIGSLIEITSSDRPRPHGIPLLRATIHMVGLSVANVNVGGVVGVNGEVLSPTEKFREL